MSPRPSGRPISTTSAHDPSPSVPISTSLKTQATHPPSVRERGRIYPTAVAPPISRRSPALAQGRIVCGPVRDPAPLFRDAVTALSIGLERHRGSRVIGGGVHLRQPSPHANRPIRATNSLPQVNKG